MMRKTYLLFCVCVLAFLMLPLLIIIPLSLNSQPYLTLTQGMLHLEPDAFSTRWYSDFFSSPTWSAALRNSMIVGVFSTIFATVLGTVTAVGLSRRDVPFKSLIMAIILSPMVVPVIVTASGMYFAFSNFSLTQSMTGLVVAHTVVAVPMVVLTVCATLVNFDKNLVRASMSLGASPWESFFKITLPLILPGVLSGAIFAFATSLDEVVVTAFLAGVDQTTIPLQMWSGVRQEINPTILAAAVFLTIISLLLLLSVEILRSRASGQKSSNACTG